MKRVKFTGSTKINDLIEYLWKAEGEEGVIYRLHIISSFRGGPSISDNYINFEYEVEPIRK